MKVGLLTWYNREENCGQTLQAFALQYMLNQKAKNINCVVIDYMYLYRKIYLNRLIWPIYHVYSLFRRKAVQRSIIFDIFIRKNMVCSKIIFSKKEVEKFIKKENIEALILGSDQIWNPQSGEIPDVMKLDFAENIIKISYSPSMCSSSMAGLYTDEIKKIADAISSFSYVGVRENSAKEMLARFSRKDINVLLDPVFLLDKKEWLKFANRDYHISQKFILVYCVGIIPTQMVEMIHRIMLDDSINRVLFIKTDKGQKVPVEWQCVKNVGPAEFLALVASAEYIFCDSFHMTAFSIIFKKNFYVFPTIIKKYEPNLERIVDLLDRFNLGDRYINCETIITDIDYSIYGKQIEDIISNTHSEFEKICALLCENNCPTKNI